MKKFKNVTTEIKKDENEFTNFADLSKVCVNQTPKEGLDVTEMRSRLKIMDALESANGEINLEDTESETLKKCVASMKWAIMHKDLVSFIETVENL